MRISARSSSARKDARAESFAPANPFLRALEENWAFWAILLLAALLRFLFLGIKPAHFDEGINGWFVDQMVSNGYYKYDPTNYHGPLHFYVLLLFQNVFGRNLWALRLPVVLVSIGAVWLTLSFDRVLPRLVARLAALAMAISPAFVFYGRYSIHEVWLLLFSMMFTLGLLGLWRHGTVSYLWFTGLGIAGMILTKETYIIHLGCALIAIPVTYLSNLVTPAEEVEPAEQKWDWQNLVIVAAVAIGSIVFFYSGTFFHWSGVNGLYQTFHAWLATGHNGNGHEKPFYYWLMLLLRYEWPVLIGLALPIVYLSLTKTIVQLAAVGAIIVTGVAELVLWVLWRSDHFSYSPDDPHFWAPAGLCLALLICFGALAMPTLTMRFLTIMGTGVLTAYSIVNYKTPWCLISIVWPFLFVFGAFVLISPKPRLNLAHAAATFLLFVSLGFSISLNYFRCTTFLDPAWDKNKTVARNIIEFFKSEPYVYVQTYNDIYKLTTPVLTLAHRNPALYQIVGHIIRPSPYPLPWILDDFPNVGYYEHGNSPTQFDADFLLVEEDRVPEVESKLLDSYFTVPLTIRPYQDASKLYFRARLFRGFFPDKVPDFVGKH